jgi:hypothetical protein
MAKLGAAGSIAAASKQSNPLLSRALSLRKGQGLHFGTKAVHTVNA